MSLKVELWYQSSAVNDTSTAIPPSSVSTVPTMP
jgi:hypothetical protein